MLDGHRKIYIDGTEQPVRRPSDAVEQRENYSGKKKRHTSKILVVSDEEKKILVITPTYVGKTHDFGILKEESLEDALPTKTPIYVDTGFEGLESINEDLNIRKPTKKPKGKKLNGGQTLGNRLISRERVKVEHAIGGLKRFNIVAGIFRGITHSMDMTFAIASGLWNLHLSLRL